MWWCREIVSKTLSCLIRNNKGFSVLITSRHLINYFRDSVWTTLPVSNFIKKENICGGFMHEPEASGLVMKRAEHYFWHTLDTWSPILSFFPYFSLTAVLCDPTDLIWRKGVPFEAMTGRTACSSGGFPGFPSALGQMPGNLCTAPWIISLSP